MEEIEMRRINFFSVMIFLVILAIGAGLSYALYAISVITQEVSGSQSLHFLLPSLFLLQLKLRISGKKLLS